LYKEIAASIQILERIMEMNVEGILCDLT